MSRAPPAALPLLILPKMVAVAVNLLSLFLPAEAAGSARTGVIYTAGVQGEGRRPGD